MREIKILLVEDNLGDVILAKKAFVKSKVKNKLYIVRDGEQALAFLRNKKNIRPDIILLDINMPKKNGLEVLEEIKLDVNLKAIPVIILTTSSSKVDILNSYNKYASSYLVKPLDIDEFLELVRKFTEYWFCIVKLPG